MKTVTFDEKNWQVVPKQPVNEMTGRVEEMCNIGMGLSHPIYEAMLAVAPSPPEVEVEPVAWVDVVDRHEGPYNFHGKELLDSGKHLLYLHPPTEEIEAIRRDAEKAQHIVSWLRRNASAETDPLKKAALVEAANVALAIKESRD